MVGEVGEGRTGNGWNRQLQRPIRRFFASLRMTTGGSCWVAMVIWVEQATAGIGNGNGQYGGSSLRSE